MALNPANFLVNISPNPVGVVVGMTGTFNLLFSNTSLVDRGYNLSAQVTLPDGVSFASSTVVPTSVITDPLTGIITLSWTNIKDLAPNEVDYSIGVTVKADEFFRISGSPVPFDVPLVSINLAGTVDTLPRGNDDPGNQQITKTASSNFIPLRYNLTKSAPGKMPKGAGLLSPVTSPIWPYQYTLTVMNNSREPSTVTLIDNLPNGVRYLDNLTVSGPDAAILLSPTVTIPTPGPNCQNFVTLNWGTVTISTNSVNIINFNAAIWDNFTVNCIENSGSRIPHMSPMVNTATLNGQSGPVQALKTTNAMDATINKSVASSSTDVGQINNYTLVYRINQYDNVNNFTVTDIIGNGQSYNVGSASIPPSSITTNPDGTTTLVWNLGLQITGTSGTITFSSTVNPNYVLLGPVSAGDTLTNNVNINGTNVAFLTPTPDSSSASTSIIIPGITKQLLNYYYKDGTPKPIQVAAPGDLVEFKITYSSQEITAEQRNIEIDEYAPLNMGPLTAALPVTYGGTLGTSFTPFTVSPNGLRWALGTVPGNSLWTAQFRIPVQNTVFVGSRNNLAKLAGNNTPGFAYSDRSQVAVNFGKPNIQFSKTVTGPNIDAIKAGETYTYSITISNPQLPDGSVVDAFLMDLTDVVPPQLIPTGTPVVTGTGTHTTPVISGQNVSMTILQLAPNQSLTLSYSVLVANTVVAGQSYTNNAVMQQPYSQPDRSFQYPGSPFTASTTLKALGVTMTKLASPAFVKIGDTTTYILQVTVPAGTTAFNLRVTDTFPSATQTYIVGSALKDGSPITPTVSGGTVSFPAIPFVDATAGAVTITYSFDVRVIGGTHVSPFIENQVDNARVDWDINSTGTPATPFTTSFNLQVRTPNLTGTKEQRNVTAGQTSFTTSTVNYNVGDIIEYRITIRNTGAETAYNSVITDVINTLLSVDTGSISPSLGTASLSGSTLTWNIPTLAAGSPATLIFRVTTLPGIGAGATITDRVSFIYNTNNNGFGVSYGPINSNTVTLRSRLLTIAKQSSISQGKIGDDITYTLTITVPNGTIAYTPVIDDTLPAGQTYIGPSTQQILPNPPTTVVPSISGQTITFPTIPILDASLGAITVIYTFIARITNATHNPPYQETQTDSGRVRWSITSGGGLTQSTTATRNIIATTPNITILKEQRNFTTGGTYTTSNISGLPGNVIYYRFTITSNGASPAYNINFSDILSSSLTFASIISGPTTGTVTNPPPGPGGTLTWNIPQLNNGSTATLEFSVSINNGVAASSTINNQASSTYDSNTVNPVTYNQNSNATVIVIPPLGFTKSVLPTTTGIGSTVQYTLTVTIPAGVTAYNLTIRDVFPSGQQYVPGSWSPGTPVIQNNKITFTDPISPEVGPQTLVYTFNTTVVNGNTSPPFTQTQTNAADLFWNLSEGGTPAPAVSSSADVVIQSPHITSLKEQRNATTGGSFTTSPIPGVVAGNVIEYRITLNNNGAGTAYNVTTSDILDNFLTFQSVISVIPPSIVIPPVGPGGVLTWTIASLAAGATAVLIFSVIVNPGFPAGTNVFDTASTLYGTDPINPTILGPVSSNTISFNFDIPSILKSVDKNAVLVGSTITYTIAFTVPAGGIIYNAQVTDVLPPNQSYVPDTLTRNGTPIIPSPTLTFPNEGTVNASSGAVTITYTFNAVVNTLTTTPQDAQTDTAALNWNTSEGGPAGPTQSASATVYVTNSTITLSKAQRNFTTGLPVSFTTAPIQVSTGDIIYYQLTVTNPSSTNTIYNVDAKDILSPLLQFNSIVTPPPAGSIIFSSGVVQWFIASVPPSTTYNAVIGVSVLPGGGSQGSIPDSFTATFTATNTEPINTYGPANSNTVNAVLPSLSFSKTPSSTNTLIGDVITYTLTVIVPNGVIAYNALVSDTLPTAQTYASSATRNGVPISPTVSGQLITFPTESVIDATLGAVTIIYTFDARIISGNTMPPYTEVQTDSAILHWNINSQGTPANPVSSTVDITVSSPSVSILKEQRNVTNGSGYTTDVLNVNIYDIIRYKLTVTNTGAASAFHVVTTDILDQFDLFINFVVISTGNASFDVSTQTVTWIIDELPAGASEFITFDLQIKPGAGAGQTDQNQAVTFFNTNTETPITVGPINSNIVIHKYPNVSVSKTASTINTTIGNIITYTVAFTLPNGTVAYNGQFTDIIPIGQTYADNATFNGAPVPNVEVIGQFIAFPVVPFADATQGTQTYVFTFDTLVVSAVPNPTTLIDIQTNSAFGNWYLNPTTPAPGVQTTTSVNVTNSSIAILKQQRNATTEGTFTTSPINGLFFQTVEYSLTVTNTGVNSVLDIIVNDILSTSLAFVAPVSVPVGTLVHTGGSSGGTVTWSIASLAIGASVTAVYSVRILKDAPGQINNVASGDFRITPTNPSRFGPAASNTTVINVLGTPSINISKASSESTVAIGDTITYTLTVNIPANSAAYNIVIRDILPLEQQYVQGSWSPGTPVITDNKISFTDPISPRIGPLTLVYTFQALVVSGNFQSPYSQTQRNVVSVFWDLSPTGPSGTPVSGFVDITVNAPSITALKEQRNVTTGGSFTTLPLQGVSIGNTIEYRITLNNVGAATAYNIITTDVLSPVLTYLNVVPPAPPGTVVSSVPAGSPDGTITWTLPTLLPGTSQVLVFSVNVNQTPPPQLNITDNTSTIYDTSTVNPVTLGPTESNSVAFGFNNPVITKSADKQGYLIGEIVTYTVTLTVPAGNIIYDSQVTDSLPAAQSYIPDSLTRNGVPVLPSPTLVFPFEGTINALGGDVTIIYTFEARVNSVTVSPQDAQTDTATINWNIAPGGPAGTPQTATAIIYATDSSIALTKAQRNVSQGSGQPFTTGIIVASEGDLIQFQFTVSNTSTTNSIFNITINDLLSQFFTFIQQVSPPPAGVITHSGEPFGGTVTWDIAVIPPSTTYSTVIEVGVVQGASTQIIVSDTLSAVFTATNTIPIVVYGPTISNTVQTSLASLGITKTASPSSASIGDIVDYTITVTIPAGLSAYNVTLRDVLPSGQRYVAGSWSPGTPVVDAGNINFVNPVSPLVGPLTLIYTFQAEVISGLVTPPFIVTQTNTVSVFWDITPTGPAGTTSSSSANVSVTAPSITSLKEQRNATHGGSFTTSTIPGVGIGDTVEYRITLYNIGAGTAYNVVTTDKLDSKLIFTGVVNTPPGIVTSSVPPGSPDGTITWTVPSIPAGTSVVLIFSVVLLEGLGLGGNVQDVVNTVFDTSIVNPVTLGPVHSNTVGFNFADPEIFKVANKFGAFIGDTILYTIVLDVTQGTIIYDAQVSDTLPLNQSYVQNSLTRNGVPILPSPVLTFPNEGTIDATAAPVIITYTFEAIVIGISTTPQDAQTDTATINWNIQPEGPAGTPQSASAIVYVTDTNIILSKGQRNFTLNGSGSFTTSPISARIGDILYYQFTVTNPNTVDSAFNVDISDILSSRLQFVNEVTPPPIGVISYSGGTSDGIVTWQIASLPPSSTYSTVIAVQVLPGAENVEIPDSLSGTFTATNTVPLITYGPKTSPVVVAGVFSLQLNKTVVPTSALVGQTVTYSMTLTVPTGVIAYNVILTDTLPQGQVFAGAATINGQPVTPTISGQNVIFPAQPIIDATTGSVVILYSFNALIQSIDPTQPLPQMQVDNAVVNWDVNQQGTPGIPAAASASVNVNQQNFNLLRKEQATTSGNFTIANIPVVSGQTILYRLTLTNTTSAKMFNIAISDILSSDLAYKGVLFVSVGTITHTGETSDGTVRWTLDSLEAGSTATAVFMVKVLRKTSRLIQNNASGSFKFDPDSTQTFNIDPSNTVTLISSSAPSRGVRLKDYLNLKKFIQEM